MLNNTLKHVQILSLRKKEPSRMLKVDLAESNSRMQNLQGQT